MENVFVSRFERQEREVKPGSRQKAGLGREGLGERCRAQTWQICPDKGAVRDVCCHTVICKLIFGKTKASCKPSTLPFKKKRKPRNIQEVYCSLLKIK